MKKMRMIIIKMAILTIALMFTLNLCAQQNLRYEINDSINYQETFHYLRQDSLTKKLFEFAESKGFYPSSNPKNIIDIRILDSLFYQKGEFLAFGFSHKNNRKKGAALVKIQMEADVYTCLLVTKKNKLNKIKEYTVENERLEKVKKWWKCVWQKFKTNESEETEKDVKDLFEKIINNGCDKDTLKELLQKYGIKCIKYGFFSGCIFHNK